MATFLEQLGFIGGLLQQPKVAKPANPPAGTYNLYYDTAGLGAPATPELIAIDQNGVQEVLACFASGSYRLIGIRVLIAGVSYVPTAGTRAIYVECVGGGGQGGGAATSSATASVGGGGGGGEYAASFLINPANPTAYAIGAGGSTGGAGAVGQAGGDTTWGANLIVAKGGAGGPVLAAAATFAAQPGGAGGGSGAGTGTLQVSGGIGDKGIRLSGTQAWSGDGGAAAWLGAVGANGVVAIAGGAAGVAAATGAYGSGGSGAATLTTAKAGGNGQQGLIRVTEFA